MATRSTSSTTKASEDAKTDETTADLGATVTDREAAEAKQADDPTPTAIAEPEGTYATHRTVEGKDGVERIIVGSDDGWEPAPVDPDPVQVERAKARLKAEEERKTQRTSGDVADRQAEDKDKS